MYKNSRKFRPRYNSQRGGFKRNHGPKFDLSLLVNKADTSIVKEVYQPKNSFDGFLISEQLKQNIRTHEYLEPTSIQDQVIPHLLAGRDVVGIANTGTGKTAAFLIPFINKIFYNRSERVLIVAPTRELAVQLQEESKAFSQGMGIFSVLCIGGVNIHPQKQNLRKYPSIVIGTPGRLKDLKMQGNLNIASFTSIVLDEVDKMLDMGFIHDIKFIISHLPKDRQSLFFSATLPKATASIMGAFLRDPVTISAKTGETAPNVDQDIIKVNGRLKIDVLHDLLAQEEMQKVLIFGRTKWGVEKLSKQLIQRHFNVAALHGNKNQNQRQRALDQFRNNEISILLVTDVASRGLDILDITHVINYDLPESYDDYIHRIGRTGRMDKKGIALSFID